MKKLLWLIIPITALANIAQQADAQGQQCWRTPSGWVCQQRQQTNPSNGQ